MAESSFEGTTSQSIIVISPLPSHVCFQHWEPKFHDMDMRRPQRWLACVGLVSTVFMEDINWVMMYYDQEGIFMKPLGEMRPHLFNYKNTFRISRIVLTPKLVALGVGALLHHIELCPNGYKMAIALYMLYISCGFDHPTM